MMRNNRARSGWNASAFEKSKSPYVFASTSLVGDPLDSLDSITWKCYGHLLLGPPEKAKL